MMLIHKEKKKTHAHYFPLKFILIIYEISIYDILQVKTFLQKHWLALEK